MICEGATANKMVEIIRINNMMTSVLFFTIQLQLERLYYARYKALEYEKNLILMSPVDNCYDIS